GGEVVLAMEVSDRHVRFRVRDTGVGIPPEHQETVFAPFWQPGDVLTRVAGGAGLGVAVARGLARMLGGDVTVESEPGRGSTFTVDLPRWSERANGEGPPFRPPG